MRRGALVITAIAATAAAVTALIACTGDDPDIEVGPDAAASDGGTATSPDGNGGNGDGSAPGDSGGADAVIDAKRQFACNKAPCAGDDVVCCKSTDLDGATCVVRTSCFEEFAKIECNDRADCPADQYCCSRVYHPTPDSGPPHYYGAYCATGCAESVVCSTSADCPDPNMACTATGPDVIPTMTLCN